MTEVIAKEPIVFLAIDEHSHTARLMGFLPDCPGDEITKAVDKKIDGGYVVYGVRFARIAKIDKSEKPVPPKPDPTLKEGDFVRMIKKYGDFDIIGLEGEVRKFTTNITGQRTVGVKFARHSLIMHSLDGDVPNGHGWYFPYNDGKKFLWSEYLEKIP